MFLLVGPTFGSKKIKKSLARLPSFLAINSSTAFCCRSNEVDDIRLFISGYRSVWYKLTYPLLSVFIKSYSLRMNELSSVKKICSSLYQGDRFLKEQSRPTSLITSAQNNFLSNKTTSSHSIAPKGKYIASAYQAEWVTPSILQVNDRRK